MLKKITFFGSFGLLAILTLSLVTLLLPHFFGWEPIIVEDVKMSPAYEENSLVFVKKQELDQVYVGEPISYYVDQGETIKTRWVIAVEPSTQTIYTKSNTPQTEEDHVVSGGQIVGQPIFQIPYIGILLSSTIFEVSNYLVLVIASSVMLITSWNALDTFLKKRREHPTVTN